MSPLSTLSQASNEDLACLPYGVGHGDEGVCLLVKIGPYRVLLDCGLTDISPLIGTDGLPVCDLVICTHAHADHARGLLALHRTFPDLPIYASEVTNLLLPLNWLDTAADLLQFGQALPWRRTIEFQDGLTAELFPAGHLPGAAAILLTYKGFYQSYSIFYTGDFFLSNSRLVEGLHLDSVRNLRPDVLIVEGSYGTARHPHRRQQENTLMAQIDRAITEGRSIIFPVLTLGTAQELLILLRSHHLFTGRDIDIWVDDRIAAGCNSYLQLLPHFPPAVQNFARHQSLFWDERVRPHVRQITPETFVEIQQRPSIILSAEGDIDVYIQDNPFAWLVLIPSQPHDRLKSLTPTNRIAVANYLLSQHSDGAGTAQLIHNIRPKHIVFVHGSPTYLADLTALEELQNRYHLHSPASGTLVSLPIGDTFIQPAPPADPQYEGELTELESAIEITLPTAIASDPRWHNFADTGLVEARWQGEEIVISGISQRELLSRQQDLKIDAESECCGNCQHQRGSRCYNPRSPLNGFKVTPDGYCPAFESEQP